MAALENIRKRSGLLLAVIGIAMLAFILGDFMQSQRSGGNSSRFVGEIYGDKILQSEFEIEVQKGLDNWKIQNPNGILTQTLIGQIRSQIWNQYIKDIVMSCQYDKLGIGLSDDEWMERLSGNNVHREISQIPAFQNPTTGQFDRSRVLGYLKQINEDASGDSRSKWVGFQDYLVNLIQKSKYDALISNSMYVTSKEAVNSLNNKNQNTIFSYVKVPYSYLPDSLFSVEERDINKYYKNNIDDYQQKASKDVEFVVFQVVPSNDDDLETKNSLNELIIDFSEYEDYELLVRRNSDNNTSSFPFFKKENLESSSKDLYEMDKGSVIGPFLINKEVYRISKLVDIQYRPDSVKARHILLKPTESIDLDSLQIIAERLKLDIQNGTDFGKLAQGYSEDKGSAIKGGDLGWFEEGVMVNEFNEVCFTANRKDLEIVQSQFGLHLIQVQNHSKKIKKVKIAHIDRNIEPSTETFNNYYSQAIQFASKLIDTDISFDSLVISQNLVKRNDAKVHQDRASIVGLPNSREMVRWMNEAIEGSISEVFQFDNSYVVAHLTDSRKEGDIPLFDVREEITSIVLNNNKYNSIKKKKEIKNLEEIASLYNTSVIKSNKATFSNVNMKDIGYEPVLAGVISNSNLGVSGPIKGLNAMYFVDIIKRDTINNNIQFQQEKEKIRKELGRISATSSYNALLNKAAIEDKRSVFY